jgi:hypothetical protein
MRFIASSGAIALIVLGGAAGCSRREAPQAPVATASLSFPRPQAPLGSPLEVTYKFQVAADAAPFDQNYRVMVHFLDGDQEMRFTDDHDPPVPTSKWQRGQTIEYSRTVFIPIVSYIGDATVHVGLYSPKDQRRLVLAGQDTGQREYNVAKIQLLPTSENVFILYKEGWHPNETPGDNSAVEWKWTKKVATVSFRNPKKDSVFYLDADNPGTYAEPQTVTVKVNGQPVDTIAVTPRQEFVHKTPLTAAQLGSADMVELALEVDKTWVPALVPAANSRDPRELGVRVFHVFVEPRN